MPHSLVGTLVFLRSLQLEARSSSKMFVAVYHTTQNYIPEDCNLNTHHLENLKSQLTAGQQILCSYCSPSSETVKKEQMMTHDQTHIFKLPTVKKTSYLKLYVLHAQVRPTTNKPIFISDYASPCERTYTDSQKNVRACQT